MRFHDLTKMRFGKITALCPIDIKTRDRSKKWECVCDCGKKIIAKSRNLEGGYTKDCGCQNVFARRGQINGTAECSRCGQRKRVDNFRSKPTGCGIVSNCKDCEKIINREDYWTNPEKHKNRVKEYSYKVYGYKPRSEWRYITKDHTRLRKRITQQNRLAKYKGKKIALTEWLTLLKEKGNKCYYCGSEENIVMDHVFPLSRGGDHCISNIVPACLSCNSSKGKKTLKEWIGKDGIMAQRVA